MIRNTYAKAHRLNRAAAPILGIGAAASVIVSAYQMEGIRAEIRDARTEAREMRTELSGRMDKMEDRIDRRTITAAK